MYKIEKRFTLPMGHRLSKHKGRCSSIHGHNITILIGVMSQKLNDNDMVIDFADLKKIVLEILDVWDHCLLLNECDGKIEELAEAGGMRIITFNFDPTAEKLSETLYTVLDQRISQASSGDNFVELEYVTIYENENSKATFME